jgi:prevent-host-death family protein
VPFLPNWSDDYLPVILKIMKERVLSASEFKAKCLACLGEIEQFGEPITITRRGRPVAVLGPAKRTVLKSPRNSLAHKGKIVGDIVNQDTSALWEVVGRK